MREDVRRTEEVGRLDVVVVLEALHDLGATGTALRPDTVAELAARAGSGRCEVLPVANDLFRFYRLDL